MSEWFILAVMVWWTFAVVVFAFMTYERMGRNEALTSAAFWPFWVAISFPVMVWRLPFKTTKAIRTDLRNRKLLKEFDAWRKLNADNKEGQADA